MDGRGEREILLENNKILHKLLSAQRWATFWSVLRWAIILGVPIVAFYYFQPYLNKLLDTYQQVSGQISNMPDLKSLLPGGLF